jgi:hypothetical protein
VTEEVMLAGVLLEEEVLLVLAGVLLEEEEEEEVVEVVLAGLLGNMEWLDMQAQCTRRALVRIIGLSSRDLKIRR